MKTTIKIIKETYLFGDQIAIKRFVALIPVLININGGLKKSLLLYDYFEATLEIIHLDEVKPVVPIKPLPSIQPPVEPSEPPPPIPIQPPAPAPQIIPEPVEPGVIPIVPFPAVPPSPGTPTTPEVPNIPMSVA